MAITYSILIIAFIKTSSRVGTQSGLNITITIVELLVPVKSELETFLLELGAGFSFVARQKRIQLDGDDFYCSTTANSNG